MRSGDGLMIPYVSRVFSLIYKDDASQESDGNGADRNLAKPVEFVVNLEQGQDTSGGLVGFGHGFDGPRDAS